MPHPIHATSLVPDHQTTSPHRRPQLAPSRISTDVLCPRIRGGDIRLRAGGSTGCGRLGACASSQRYPSLRGWCSAVGVIVAYLELWRPLWVFWVQQAIPTHRYHTSMIWNPRRRHHPVKLGDIYHDTYEKLGYGTYSTVWLARGHHRRLTKTNPAIFA